MKVLPLVVLVHDAPVARAYLASMRRAGLRPARIVLMVSSHDPNTKKPVGRWLPGKLRRAWAEQYQAVALNHWPGWIRRTHPGFVERFLAELEKSFPDAKSLIEEILGGFRYDDYASEVDRLLVRGLADERLADHLHSLSPATVLFTGGGLVPRSLLELEGLRFLHVHPGTLPEVRGADGLLWSMLTRGRPGASCFYMAPGIDEGDLVAAKDFPAVRVALEGARLDDDTLYRALFSFYDPLLRASLLVNDVLPLGDLDRLPSRTQDLSCGLTYHFLHDGLRHVALHTVFPDAQS